MRLQKYLSRAGVASRREAERWILQGRVSVNGQVVRELGTRVDEAADRVVVDGKPVRLSERRWLMLNKAPGTLTTRRDPGGAPTVYDSLPPEHRELPYVGRLDRETEGLLLFTNDGDAANALLHPSGEVEREYEVWVETAPTERTRSLLLSGIPLEDGPARAVAVGVPTPDGRGVRFSLVIIEGRKREVRRMMRAIGHPVLRLRRVRFGDLALDSSLELGQWRTLKENEIQALAASVSK